MHEAIAELDDKELEEMKEYFNSVTSEDDLGDVLFSDDNTFEDVQAKINSMDDEGQQQFSEAIKESQLITIEVSDKNWSFI